MRTVLVCVRTPLAAQTVASTAARLGMTGVVRTAVSETEAMIRLAERPAEVVLADTAVTRPDSVGFTRRVLARAPQAFRYVEPEDYAQAPFASRPAPSMMRQPPVYYRQPAFYYGPAPYAPYWGPAYWGPGVGVYFGPGYYRGGRGYYRAHWH